jgi:hypothetical protein
VDVNGVGGGVLEGEWKFIGGGGCNGMEMERWLGGLRCGIPNRLRSGGHRMGIIQA